MGIIKPYGAMYKNVWLCIKLHNLFIRFIKQIGFLKKMCFLRNKVIVLEIVIYLPLTIYVHNVLKGSILQNVCTFLFYLLNKCYFFKSCCLRNNVMFLEAMIFKISGTNLSMFKIVCKMYLMVWLYRNVHTLLSWFNKQM